jgi:hypothetical protein
MRLIHLTVIDGEFEFSQLLIDYGDKIERNDLIIKFQ